MVARSVCWRSGRSRAPRGEQLQPALEPALERLRREQLHACGGELDGQRQPVEPPADLLDRLAVELVVLEGRQRRFRPRREERDRVRRAERRNGQLALVREVQPLAARDEHGDAGRIRERAREVRRGAEHVLEVVEDQEHAALAEMVVQRLLQGAAARGFDAERLADRRHDERGVVDAAERDERDAVRELLHQLAADLEREARLAAAAGARQRHEPRVGAQEQLAHVVHLPRAADDRRRRLGQVRVRERLQRRELLREAVDGKLEELDRLLEVLEHVVAELEQRRLGDDGVARRAGDQHLAAVAGRADARGGVDVDPDVVVGADDAGARVDAHPHAQLAVARPRLRCELLLGRRRRRDCAVGLGEDRKERVAVRRDLAAARAADRLTQQAVVLRERLVVVGAELVQQPGRALDVREDERDGAGGERLTQESVTITVSRAPEEAASEDARPRGADRSAHVDVGGRGRRRASSP